MPKFNVGYPTRTGDIEKDFQNLYNYICELSDRLSYILNSLPETAGQTNTDESQ